MIRHLAVVAAVVGIALFTGNADTPRPAISVNVMWLAGEPPVADKQPVDQSKYAVADSAETTGSKSEAIAAPSSSVPLDD